jgi:atypical dual specificity phosphatase
VGSTFTEGWDACCVAPSLWVGAASAVSLPCVQALGITHVLSIMRDAPSPIPGIAHLAIDVLDIESEFLLDAAVPQALNFIHAALHAQGCVLAHCQHGHSRSVAIVSAFLMRSRGIAAAAAVDIVAAARLIDINPAFQSQLLILQHANNLQPTLHSSAHSRWRLSRLQSRILASRGLSRTAVGDLHAFAAPAFPEHAHSATARDCLRCANCSAVVAMQGNVVRMALCVKRGV